MTTPIELRSDNAAGAAPEIVEALVAANEGSARAYGDDAWTARLSGRAREVFEREETWIFPVATGTAANALGLSALCPPWGAVLCHETAHIAVNEAAATSMFSAGAPLRGVGGAGYRVDPQLLADALDAVWWGDPHQSQPAVLSLTEPTDYGTLYRVDQVRELASIAARRHLRTHLDGARIANALVALGCSPAELTWRSGATMLSLGATKNGGVSTDAIVCFDGEVADQLRFRLKRAGQVASKMRFQSAQLLAYLDDGLWLRLAERANAAMARLARGLRDRGVELVAEPEANIAFVRVDPAVAARMAADGLLFYEMRPGLARLVTSFQSTDAEMDEALARIDSARRG
ncbi:MAG: beta-eliminating lyase-related protein [Acidimicrobiia bacterium]|nr:beta-eliminating lyase-related protein [Acidimicrobiia bacterium]